MSTLRAGTLSNIPGTGSPAITGGELSRARFNLNGTGTIAARDSFNVTSFTDFGTGLYTATFSVAMPSVNYTALSNATAVGVSLGIAYVPSNPASNQAVGSIGAFYSNAAGTATDMDWVQTAIFGDIP